MNLKIRNVIKPIRDILLCCKRTNNGLDFILQELQNSLDRLNKNMVKRGSMKELER